MLRIRILYNAQKFFYISRCNGDLLYTLCSNFHGGLAADSGNFSLQNAYTGFPRVAADDAAQSIIGNAQLPFLQAVLFKLLGDKMLPGDLHLFLIGVAAQLDNLHTVQQRAGNGVGGIGRGDEHDPAQVHGNL